MRPAPRRSIHFSQVSFRDDVESDIDRFAPYAATKFIDTAYGGYRQYQ
jgi:hypothetical protein